MPTTSLFHRRAFIVFYAICLTIIGFWVGNDVRGAVDAPASIYPSIQLVPQYIVDEAAFRLYIVQWEGCSVTPVYHPARPYTHSETTVGIGHNVRYGMELVGGYQPHRHYTPREITLLYTQDYARAIGACRVNVAGFDSLPRPARFVCLSLAWTCGPTGFSRWHDLQADLEHHMYSIAASELLSSRWSHQVVAVRLKDHWRALDSLSANDLTPTRR